MKGLVGVVVELGVEVEWAGGGGGVEGWWWGRGGGGGVGGGGGGGLRDTHGSMTYEETASPQMRQTGVTQKKHLIRHRHLQATTGLDGLKMKFGVNYAHDFNDLRNRRPRFLFRFFFFSPLSLVAPT